MACSASAIRKRIDVLLDAGDAARDPEKAAQIRNKLLEESDAFDRAPVINAADADAKLRDAAACFEGIDLGKLAEEVCRLRRSVKKIDGRWLRDLRAIRSRACDDPYADYAIRCIDSVIIGMSRPRLVMK